MKKFALYYDNNGIELIGTDCYLPLDARYTDLHNCLYIKQHPHTKFVKQYQDATSFRICSGSLAKPILGPSYNL